MVDAGWVLGILCEKRLIEPMNIDKAIYCGKVLLFREQDNFIYEGAGVLKALTDPNEDDILAAVSKDKTIERLCKLLADYCGNEPMIERLLITCGNIATSNSPLIIEELLN